MAADSSKKAVVAALGGNTLVCIAKFGGFSVTGSGAMLSEAIHTLADVMNQALLLFGIVRSTKEPDPDFPYGYQKERFVWALISAVGIFFLGCGVTIYHGIHSLLDPGHTISEPGWAIGVLLVSLLVEAFVLVIAAKSLLAQAKEAKTAFVTFCRTKADPSAVAVLLEDAAACFGVLIALTAIGLTMVTGKTYWDGIGSILIGILLGFVAFWLIQRNREMLVGSSAPQDAQDELHRILERRESVENVPALRTRVEDASNYSVDAQVDFDGKVFAKKLTPMLEEAYPGLKEGTFEEFQTFAGEFAEAVTQELSTEIRALEAEIKEAIPNVTHIDVEPE